LQIPGNQKVDEAFKIGLLPLDIKDSTKKALVLQLLVGRKTKIPLI
jgi:hypothetical protein